ncbi:MAG: hypothetical protein R3251_03590 [Candidatus Spechtbacterales bacterium]|nr:hypothetical protein [Candidatus Spechtbacterales bacterium]
MQKGLKMAGIFFVLAGLALMLVGGAVFMRANAGLKSLDAVYKAQGIELSYNDNGELIDRGTVEGANAILSLLEDDWKYPLMRSNLDPSDPLVNTADELMVQFATISYHVLHGEHTVTLEEEVEYKGETFEPGEYTVEVDGRYYSDFDRMHPLEGPVRTMAWSPLVHGLLAEISAGVSADMLAQFALFISILVAGLGFTFAVGGFLMAHAAKAPKEGK